MGNYRDEISLGNRLGVVLWMNDDEGNERGMVL